MANAKQIAAYIGVALPSLLLFLLSLDALLIVAEDVLILSLLQLIFLAIFIYRVRDSKS